MSAFILEITVYVIQTGTTHEQWNKTVCIREAKSCNKTVQEVGLKETTSKSKHLDMFQCFWAKTFSVYMLN